MITAEIAKKSCEFSVEYTPIETGELHLNDLINNLHNQVLFKVSDKRIMRGLLKEIDGIQSQIADNSSLVRRTIRNHFITLGMVATINATG